MSERVESLLCVMCISALACDTVSSIDKVVLRMTGCNWRPLLCRLRDRTAGLSLQAAPGRVRAARAEQQRSSRLLTTGLLIVVTRRPGSEVI
jgi:hypothetical protein